MYADKTGKKRIRRFVINNAGVITDVDQLKLPEETVNQMIKNLKPHCFKCFANIDFVNVNYPNPNDILQLQSQILNNDPSYSGYASF
jgi:hypothetical protein